MRGFLFLLLALPCLALPGLLLAQGNPLHLDVGGDITIDKAGNVYDYKLNTPVSESVRQLIDRAVRKWQFEPVVRDGTAVHAKCQMSMRLVAIPVANGLQLRIERVGFDAGRRGKRMNPPMYPSEALRAGVEGEVLVALRIDEKGAVRDLLAAQSSLRQRQKKLADGRWTKAFEKAALDAAKTWKFEPADTSIGEPADTTVIVTVSFVAAASALAASGWKPDDATAEKKVIPWLPPTEQDYDATGLKNGQTLALGGTSIKLKTAVVGATL